jgi:hypothetical protein
LPATVKLKVPCGVSCTGWVVPLPPTALVWKWDVPLFPAAVTNRIPCWRSMATAPASVSGPPEPSPRPLSSLPIDAFTTFTPLDWNVETADT